MFWPPNPSLFLKAEHNELGLGALQRVKVGATNGSSWPIVLWMAIQLMLLIFSIVFKNVAHFEHNYVSSRHWTNFSLRPLFRCKIKRRDDSDYKLEINCTVNLKIFLRGKTFFLRPKEDEEHLFWHTGVQFSLFWTISVFGIFQYLPVLKSKNRPRAPNFEWV